MINPSELSTPSSPDTEEVAGQIQDLVHQLELDETTAQLFGEAMIRKLASDEVSRDRNQAVATCIGSLVGLLDGSPTVQEEGATVVVLHPITGSRSEMHEEEQTTVDTDTKRRCFTLLKHVYDDSVADWVMSQVDDMGQLKALGEELSQLFLDLESIHTPPYLKEERVQQLMGVFSGKTYREIATETGVQESTPKNLLKRIMLALAEKAPQAKKEKIIQSYF